MRPRGSHPSGSACTRTFTFERTRSAAAGPVPLSADRPPTATGTPRTLTPCQCSRRPSNCRDASAAGSVPLSPRAGSLPTVCQWKHIKVHVIPSGGRVRPLIDQFVHCSHSVSSYLRQPDQGARPRSRQSHSSPSRAECPSVTTSQGVQGQMKAVVIPNEIEYGYSGSVCAFQPVSEYHLRQPDQGARPRPRLPTGEGGQWLLRIRRLFHGTPSPWRMSIKQLFMPIPLPKPCLR